MIARARIGVAWVVSLVFAMGLTGCDFSQQTPETIDTAVVTKRVGGDTPAAASEAIDGKTAAEGERSVRLFGPGVSRQRQTRI